MLMWVRMANPLPLIFFLLMIHANLSADPCYTYTELDDTWRSISNTHASVRKCDTSVSWSGWYRLFINGLSAHIPDTCVEKSSCGTDAPLWIRGGHPTVTDGVVTRDVCGHWSNYCCQFGSFPIKVKACPGNYYVYELVSPPNCNLAYCADTDSINTSPTTVTPVTISPAAGVGTSSSGTPGTSDQARDTQPASSEGTPWTTSSTQGTSERQMTETRDTQLEETNLSADPCYTYTELDDTWRSISNTYASVKKCDQSVSWSGWYRLFINGLSAHIPDTCVAQYSCGTHVPLWMRGGHPTVTDGVVTRDVCGHWNNYCCYFGSSTIKVKACPGNYYVYELVRPTSCNLAYCADTDSINTSPTTVTPVTISPDSPRNVSVSISPSGVIVEGDSVTLNCISDSNPPAEISWIKGGRNILQSGETYSISNIKSESSGDYRCSARNKHGSQTSAAVYVNIMYPPRNVSVLISESGVIVEGDSVTLNCISDSNPPALNFSWFKGGTIVGSGRIFNISKISSDDSGEYKCKSINEHGEKYSDAVTLNVMYPPRSVSVLMSGSGVIVEGDSVTLNCISDSNPPALNFSWFKGGTIVGSGRIYNISKISSDDSGEYKCKSINEHGEKYSDAVTLNIMYSPRSVSVFISPSGVIVEGYSVTLNCISDSNPPAEISWIKGGTFVGSGRIFSISKISSDDSGEYKCKSINEHGEKYSDTVTLNIMYSPRSVSVSISPSGVIVEGDSVTLNCTSDSNPPAEISWFKGGRNILQSGETYNITNIKSESSGDYHCSARNKHGSQTSAAVNVNIMYPPRSVSVLISGSGVIVEGDSVTLNCISDSNPPAEISWIKGGTIVGSGRIYNISKISSDDSGEYKCKSINEHGEKYSDAVTLNIMYSPRNVSVSISPSGVIVEGDSVTLNCISDSNPPAEISWIKGGTFVGSGRIFSISKISSDDSGEYKCKSINEHGEKYSDTVTLNIMYSPRSVSVSISPSGVIVEGDSVTLNCISDSNPPAEISWFKGGRDILQSGETYSITNIKSEASGDYHCSARNIHGSQTSAAVNVNIMYPPRSVSVSISPSGVIVEGDSVTLNCISDSNPPAEISWIKGRTIVGSGRIYSISKISSDDSKTYKCKSRNEHGEKYSDAVTLNVMYPPRSVSVSISPSGVIVEGDSVTLNCISDSNPPAEISWIKGGTIVRSGRIYSISKISSDDSGEYKCKSINKHGGKYSEAVTLNVMYPPRNVSVFISPSGVIVEGDSVTLNCISDSNPPAEISWIKGGTIVRSGRIFSISKISSDDSGEYKCKSINEHGGKYSDTVTLCVMFRCFSSVTVGVAVGVLLGGASGAFVMYICLTKRMNRRSAMKEISDPNEDTYIALELKSMTSDLSTGRFCSERRSTNEPILSSVGGATDD
ncbi:unnamed protein product [Leuciscus chuanchicus]